jgi:hypothetical protein
MVYDIRANIKLDKYREETNGITVQDYKAFINFIPETSHNEDHKTDYYQKFKSYSNALAPFAGLEFATEHGIYIG